MLRFNNLLASADIDPASVRLVRHRDPIYNRAIYEDAVRRRPRFEQYQAGQGSPRVVALFKAAQVLASFVVDERGQTVFVGLWRVRGFKNCYVPDPYRGTDPAPSPTSVFFDLERMAELDDYSGRVVVEWGGGERAWVQYAQRQDKQIVEVRRSVIEEPFPGFSGFRCRLSEVDGLPSAWQQVLRSARGVYLLVEHVSGAQYVGAAAGVDGFIGRWRQYANGHGGNVGMRDLARPAEAYDVSILETVGTGASLEDIYASEALWKQKLGARAQGLNRN